MSSLELRPLGREHAAALAALAERCPVVADFTVCFERGPEFFGWPDAAFEEALHAGFFEGERLVAAAMVGLLQGWTGEGWGLFAYAGDARVLPTHRGLGLAKKLGEHLAERVPAEVLVGYGIVKTGNRSAERMAARFQPGGFTAEPLCGLTTLNIPAFAPVPGKRTLTVRPARGEDLASVSRFLLQAWAGRAFAPRADLAHFERLTALKLFPQSFYLAERRGELAGVLGAWDQGSLRRTRVLRYARSALALRTLWDIASAVLPGGVKMPREGEALRALTLTHLAVQGDDPAVLLDLLAGVLKTHRGRGYHLAHLGLRTDEPLLGALRGVPVQRFESSVRLFRRPGRLVPWDRGPYLDLAYV